MKDALEGLAILLAVATDTVLIARLREALARMQRREMMRRQEQQS